MERFRSIVVGLLIPLLAFLPCSPAQQWQIGQRGFSGTGAITFTLVQEPVNNGSGCYFPATTCSVSLSPNTAAGDLVVAICGGMFNSSGPGTCATPTGESGWAHCSACNTTTNSVATGNTFFEDMYYTLSATGGASSIVCNFNTTSANVYGQFCVIYEWHRSSGTWSFVGGANGSSTACASTANTSCAGATLTLGSGPQLAIQFISGGQTNVTAISGSYSGIFGSFSNFSSTGFGAAYWNGATSGTAPNWTQLSAVAAVGGAVFD